MNSSFQSGHERSERSSRIGSVTSLSSDASVAPARSKSVTSENGELDYKKLYEESRADNERLRDKLRRSDEQLKDARSQLDKLSAQSKSSLSETEKRERRAMERKLSEMEEELKVRPILRNYIFWNSCFVSTEFSEQDDDSRSGLHVLSFEPEEKRFGRFAYVSFLPFSPIY